MLILNSKNLNPTFVKQKSISLIMCKNNFKEIIKKPLEKKPWAKPFSATCITFFVGNLNLVYRIDEIIIGAPKM